jgi:hypothetical protein
MNNDPTDAALAISAGVGVGLLGLCIIASIIRQCKKPTIKMSRSDNDLENMLEHSIPSG